MYAYIHICVYMCIYFVLLERLGHLFYYSGTFVFCIFVLAHLRCRILSISSLYICVAAHLVAHFVMAHFWVAQFVSICIFFGGTFLFVLWVL